MQPRLRCPASTLSQPMPDPLHRLAHFSRGACVRESYEMPALDRIEVDAGRRRHMRLLQHALGEFKAVGGKTRYVRIQIECAVDREKFVESCLRKAVDEDAAILLVAVLQLF